MKILLVCQASQPLVELYLWRKKMFVVHTYKHSVVEYSTADIGEDIY